MLERREPPPNPPAALVLIAAVFSGPSLLFLWQPVYQKIAEKRPKRSAENTADLLTKLLPLQSLRSLFQLMHLQRLA